ELDPQVVLDHLDPRHAIALGDERYRRGDPGLVGVEEQQALELVLVSRAERGGEHDLGHGSRLPPQGIRPRPRAEPWTGGRARLAPYPSSELSSFISTFSGFTPQI